jgi:Major Facilitator Superfamily
MDEKETGRLSAEEDGATFSAITASSEKNQDYLQKTKSQASTNIQRSISHTDGYSVTAPEDDEEGQGPEQDAATATELVVNWDENDPENPKNMNHVRKWVICLVVCMGSVCVYVVLPLSFNSIARLTVVHSTCTSSIYTMTYSQITKEFHCSDEVATLGLTTFIFGLGVGPLFLAPLSEFFGRRIIYITSFAFYVIWMIPCAVAQNIETLIVVRFFAGISGAAFLSVAGGTVGDMFHRHELAAPMMFFTASPFFGPQIGPL